MRQKISKLLIYGLSLLLLQSFLPASAQKTPRESVKILVAPERADWNYKPGEEVTFLVRVLRYGNLVKGAEIQFEILPEKMETRSSGTMVLEKGQAELKGGTMEEPGFLRCHVQTTIDGITFSNFGSAAFSPEEIISHTPLPDDFLSFWEGAKARLEDVPLDPKLEYKAEWSSEKIDTWHVSFGNVQGRIYGILCVPKGGGKYPALLRLPGAGVRAYSGERTRAELGMITLYIGIHGIPVDYPDELYTSLKEGVLSSYMRYNLDDRENYYYKRVILGCLRSVDFIHGLEAFDGENLLVYGGSQGGALSIMTAALDSRVKHLACFYPAMCDLQAYLHGRAGGWPHLFQDEFTNEPDKIHTSSYYDVVNFARLISIPGIYSWGYNDNVCPPSSMFAAYNQIKAPKILHSVPDSRHFRYPEQQAIVDAWMLDKLGIKNE